MLLRTSVTPLHSESETATMAIHDDGAFEATERPGGVATLPGLSPELRGRMDAYWRAANYLSVGQIYLYDNPLLRRPLEQTDVKPLVVGHWGTTPGQNFIYVHLNRVICERDLDMLYVAGPGHGGPALVANTYLEGSCSEIYPNISRDEAGLQKLFKQFSFPGGISSHVHRQRRGRFTTAASSAIRSATRSALHSITRA